LVEGSTTEEPIFEHERRVRKRDAGEVDVLVRRRHASVAGAGHELALSYFVWPPERLREASGVAETAGRQRWTDEHRHQARELVALVDDDADNAGLREVTYSNPALESIGGAFTIDCRYQFQGDSKVHQERLASDDRFPMTGSVGRAVT
jgi:hypothetical protein